MLSTTGGLGTGAVTFAVSGVGCSVMGSTLGSIGVASCSVTATKAASTGFSATVSNPVIFTFGQQPLVISNSVRSLRAGISVPLTFSGGSGTGSVYYSVVGTNCSVNTANYVAWTLTASAATTCTVTAKNNAKAGYVSTTSAPVIFEFFKSDLPTLVIKAFTNSSLTTPASSSTLYPAGTTIYVKAESPYTTPGNSYRPSTYTVSGTGCGVRDYSGDNPHYGALSASTAATCTVVGTKPASVGFNAVSSNPITFTFGVFNQLPFSIRGRQELEGNAWLSTDGGSGSGAIRISVSGANCSTPDGRNLIASAPTTCTVTATKAASTGYNAVTSAPINIEFKVFDQKPLVLTPPAASGILFTTPIALSTTGGNGNGAVTYSVTGTNCSISGSILIASAQATCSVTATKAASTFYNAISSAPVTYGFSVNNQSPLSISYSPKPLVNPTNGVQWPFSPSAQIYISTTGGSGSGAVTFSASGSTCKLSGSTLTASPPSGTYTTCVINASKAASTGYNSITAAPVSLVFGVYNQEPLIFLPHLNNSYHEGIIAIPLSTTGGSGRGAVSYSVTGGCYIEDNKLKGQAVGGTLKTCVVTAKKAEDPGYYNAITSAPLSINLTKHIAQSPLILMDTPIVAGAKSATLSTSGGSGTGVIGFALRSGSCVLSGATLSASTSTSCVVVAFKNGDTSYNNVVSQPVTFIFKLP